MCSIVLLSGLIIAKRVSSTLLESRHLKNLTQKRRKQYLEDKISFVTEARKRNASASESYRIQQENILKLGFEELREELQNGNVTARAVLDAYINR